MIKFENTEVVGWEAAIRGMRNPMNSWGNSDSIFNRDVDCGETGPCNHCDSQFSDCLCQNIGPNDHKLMMSLANGGPVHAKYRRMITVYVDITAPLYWWKEFDTYKVGTVANSCSTMHKIHEKEFTLEDFSHEHLMTVDEVLMPDSYRIIVSEPGSDDLYAPSDILLNWIIPSLNACRRVYIKLGKELESMSINTNSYQSLAIKELQNRRKRIWWQMIQLLPSSYNQRRTIMLNYEVLAGIYQSRKNHKLDEWCLHKEIMPDSDSTAQAKYAKPYKEMIGFCDWIESLPYSELITGKKENRNG